MKKDHLVAMLKLRMAVGFLGETHQHGWWPSAFFSPSSSAFLAPIFGRTLLSARYHGVREAAASVHDRHIGTGANIFHLFRLPESIERELHGLLRESEMEREIAELTRDHASVMSYVQTTAQQIATQSVGPAYIAPAQALDTSAAWQQVAQHYLNAFRTGTQTFPFFAEER